MDEFVTSCHTSSIGLGRFNIFSRILCCMRSIHAVSKIGLHADGVWGRPWTLLMTKTTSCRRTRMPLQLHCIQNGTYCIGSSRFLWNGPNGYLYARFIAHTNLRTRLSVPCNTKGLGRAWVKVSAAWRTSVLWLAATVWSQVMLTKRGACKLHLSILTWRRAA